MEHLHKNKIIYRDLKPENILIAEDGYLKLTDFGLSKLLEENEDKTKSICGTPDYLAPEMFTKQGYTKMVDWWALGVLIYEMLIGIPPFYSKSNLDLFYAIRNKSVKFPSYISKKAKNLIIKLLRKNPNERLGSKNDSEEIKNHIWFSSINWDQLYYK